jgi:hypothetical protein
LHAINCGEDHRHDGQRDQDFQKGETRLWILDTGCWVLDAGCWMLDAGFWMLGTGCWMLDAGYGMLDSGCWVLDAGCWMLGTGYGMLDAGCWMLDAGLWIMDSRYLSSSSRRFRPSLVVWLPKAVLFRTAAGLLNQYVANFNFMVLSFAAFTACL